MFLNKKIKTAIIGLGKIAWAYEKDPLLWKRTNFPTHFSVLRKHPHFQLVAVQDKSAEARSLFLRKTSELGKTPKIYKNWAEMIKKENPDLLVVASNTESHYKICNRAIEIGVKNILCEKPLSYLLKEAEELVWKAEKSRCALYVNYTRAFNASYTLLIKKIHQGLLGRIQSFDFKYSKGIFNNGTHAIDLLIRMFGAVDRARGLKNPTSKINVIDPTVSAAIEFKNGVSGYIHGINNDFYNIFELDILGELGRIKIINDKAEFFMRKKSDIVKGYNALRIMPKKCLIDTKNGLYPVYENIYQCFNESGAKKNKCSGMDSLSSLRVADKIIQSLKNEK